MENQKSITIVLLLSLLISRSRSCYLNLSEPEIKEYEWKLERGDLPKNHDWGNYEGKNYLSQMRNQHIPEYCGSCWAHAVASSISDRIAIKRGNVFPEITLSPQYLINCESHSLGCKGGSPYWSLKHIHDNFIVDETCAPYQAKDTLQCNKMNTCSDCLEEAGCWEVEKYHSYKLTDFGKLPTLDVNAMMNEIYQNGPIVCAINADPIVNFKGGKVFESDVKGDLNHIISVVGFGEDENGIPYWKVRNSWGEYWAENGYFRLKRGENTLGIESVCYWGNPDNTWSNHLDPTPRGQAIPLEPGNSKKELNMNEREVRIENIEKLGIIKSKEPKEYIDSSSLPENFFWGDINGTNYLSWTVNQHIPQYCGSCWAQATSAMLADRLNIKRDNNPRIAFSVQNLLNCRGGGSCDGGTPLETLNFIYHEGIHEYGCQNYLAKDPKYAFCEDIQKCQNCWLDSQGNNVCSAVENPRKWYVDEFGALFSNEEIKKEVYGRGPVVCSIKVTEYLQKEYKGGIYYEKHLLPQMINHYVNVVGWGKEKDTGTEFWVVRNSFGSYWGRSGYFYVKMDGDNMGMGNICWWGNPTSKVNK